MEVAPTPRVVAEVRRWAGQAFVSSLLIADGDQSVC